MAINNINLRKLLQLFYLPPNKLESKLREDIRNEIKKSDGDQSGGGDFHSPFWSDAKRHAQGALDLPAQTEIRIASNRRARHRLYPLLTAGFLQWWNEKRRWSNQKFKIIDNSVKGRYQAPNLDATVKIENILALRIDDNSYRLIYPYFSEKPRLQEEGARIGLWVLNSTLEKYQIEDMRILDVLRGQPFSISDHPLQGNEEDLFIMKYHYILERQAILREEYS